MTSMPTAARHPSYAEAETLLAAFAAIWPPGWRRLEDRERGTEVWLRDDGAWVEVHLSTMDLRDFCAVANALRCSTAGPGRWVVEVTRHPDGTATARVIS